MRSDISRQTFDPRKHYKSVRMQQGRVQIDADWNEQSDITTHRIETAGLDLIGGCGGPMHHAAFGISRAVGFLMQEEQDRLTKLGVLPLKVDDFLLTAGCYYVDGILCENDSVTSFNSQPDYPTLAGDLRIPPGGPPYLVYLDVWQHHITALDDAQIREIALGGPDTGTRLKTVWQVKLFPAAADYNCITAFNKLLNANPPSSGTLSAKTASEAPSPDPCIVPPGAGFRGLENQLYRVEIHDGGNSFNVAGGAAGTAVSELVGNNQVKVTGMWQVGQAVEIFSADAPTNLKTRTLAYVTSIDQSTGTLTFNTKITHLTMTDHPRLRVVGATFKWSRDNGSVVTTIERIEGKDITVSHTGLDDVLGFAPGHWVEITDDGLELNGRPGQLAQIAEVDSARRLITLKTDPRLLDAVSSDGVNPTLHPKLRRWDGIGAVNTNSTSADSGYIDLEAGVQVRFGTGNYRTGDYWMVPARTATADAQSGKIEWPQDDNKAPVALLPLGIHHHSCPLGLLSFDNNTGFALLDDCRHLFPPVTELTSLFYVSGEGQEVMPDLTQPALLVPLPQSLVVGVANGSWPVKDAKVRFHVEKGTGSVMPQGGAPQGDGTTIDVLTDIDGLAACDWHVDSITQSQQVQATLLDADDKSVHLPVIFTANLSVAAEVAYDPGTCATLQDQKTVQKALDQLSHLVSLYCLSGDGQEVMPNEALQPLKVQAASRCGPVTDQPVTVRFEIKSGSGTVNGSSTPVDIPTDAGGVAACNWALDNTTPFQEVEATLVADAAHPLAPPTMVRFSATLSTAAHVSYDPAACPDLTAANATTVQQAIDALCSRKTSGGCAVTVGNGGQFKLLDDAIKALLAEASDRRNVAICICLLPGDHPLEQGLNIQDEKNRTAHVKIEGCGVGSRILVHRSPIRAFGLASLTLRDLEIFANEAETFIVFDRCAEILFESCSLRQENQVNPFITISHARRIQFERNLVDAALPMTQRAASPANVFANVNPDVSDLYKASDRFEFEEKSSAVARLLAGLSATTQDTLIAQLRRSLANLSNVTAGEVESYNNFIQTLSAQPVDAPLLQANLADIRLAALRAAPGTAIVLMDPEADTGMDGNKISGVVSLYGVPGRSQVTQDDMKLISRGLRRRSVRFSGSLSNLQLRDNMIYRITVSEETIARLKAVAASSANSLDRLYRRCFIAGNAISGGNNNFVMEHLALTSNSFEREGEAAAGVVISGAAIYVGNYAPGDIRLFNATPNNQKAANLTINIVDM